MNARRLLRLAVPLAPLALLLLACGGGGDNLPPPPPPPAPPPAEAPPLASAPPAAPEPPPPPPIPPVQLVQGPAAPDPPKPFPAVRFVAPLPDQVLPKATAADFLVKLDVKNWQTATGSSHVHLILDNKAYKPLYDTKLPVKLSDLPGGDALTEGEHVLVAFPGRASHESVKTPGAFASVAFWVGKRGEMTQDIRKPLLVYSRPKGDYKGDMANHVLVDFQLAGDKLAAGGDHVRVTVKGPGADGLTADATAFGPPFFLDNLRDGSYDVTLDLLSKDNKPVPGAWSSVTRTINIQHAP